MTKKWLRIWECWTEEKRWENFTRSEKAAYRELHGEPDPDEKQRCVVPRTVTYYKKPGKII